MSRTKKHECTNCGALIVPERRNYRYAECGLSNVVLQSTEVADCPTCGNSDVSIPQVAKVHRAIARALVNSPARLTGPQFRFLRKHLELSGDELSRYLHTDKTKISKWETEQDRIGPTTDRLIRLLAAALDVELRPEVGTVAEHLPVILDQPGKDWDLHLNVENLHAAFLLVSKAA